MGRVAELAKAGRNGTALQLKPGLEGLSKGWLIIEDGRVHNLRTGESIRLAGASATVDTAGELDKRVTATRLILTGPLAFGLRKKKDSRELFVLVQGEDGSFLAEIDSKKQKEAREFALKINTLAARAERWDAVRSDQEARANAATKASGEAAPQPSPPEADILDQIRKLGELRDSGILTEEEFGAKKAQLLERI
jgi:hypothetical protein